LKLNLARGSNAALVSFNFSCKALIAYETGISTEDSMLYYSFSYLGIDSLVIGRDVAS
jgi:hypothetical protein